MLRANLARMLGSRLGLLTAWITFGTTLAQTTTSTINTSTRVATHNPPYVTATNGAVYSFEFCYTDNNRTGRALSDSYIPSNNLTTNEICVGWCANNGYAYCGSEYGNECFGGTALLNNSQSAYGTGWCNQTCTGNSTQLCGGLGWMDLYVNTASASTYTRTTTTPAPATTSSTLSSQVATTTASTRASSTSASSTSALAPVTSALTSATSAVTSVTSAVTSVTSAVTSATSVLGSSTSTQTSSTSASAATTSSTLSPSNPPSIGTSNGTYLYQGCFSDNGTARTLTGAYSGLGGQNTTREKCVYYCASNGFEYAGVEYVRPPIDERIGNDSH